MFSLVALTALLAAQIDVAPSTEPNVAYTATGSDVAAPPAGAASASTPAPDYMTRDEIKAEVQAEVKKLSWTKGDMRIVPYGTVWGSMSYDSQRAKIGDYCLWIESQSTHPGEADASVDAKSTRVGLDFFGPGIPCLNDAKVDGKVEVDFQGIFVTRNKPGLLLRHAYVEAKDEEFRLLVGQTWDVISPLGIPTLNYTAGSAVGNLAYRRAQFRGERYFALSDTSLFTLQGSLNANVVTDYVSDTSSVSADVGPYPDVQARAAITLGPRTGCDIQPTTFGISGHYGEQDYDFRTAPVALGDEVHTWSVCGDLYMPLTERFGFQAEFFTGYNLSNYMGGILQGIDRITHEGIHATGGWCDVWFKWRPNLCSHTGYALDDPDDRDMTSGKTYNQMIFANLIYDATKNLQLGMEVDVWKTRYMTLKPGDAVRIECAVKYTF